MKICLSLLGVVLCMGSHAGAQEKASVFEGPGWKLQGRVVDHLGRKSLRGSAILEDVDFENGVIEVDMAFDGRRCFAGIQLRLRPGGNFENFYIRPHKSNQPDALQYTPVFNGLSSWQLYSGPGFTAAVPVPHKQWIHVKLEVSGSQARVFLDGAAKPSLVVHDMKHGRSKGAIGLSGPPNGLAHFANFQFRRDDSLQFEDPPQVETPAGMIMNWELSQAFRVRQINREIDPRGQNQLGLTWTSVSADDTGLVDIARTAQKSGPEPQCVVARTSIRREKDVLRKLSFGYSDEVSIFLNGSILFRGNSEFRRRDPQFQGLLGLNDSVFLPLKEGANELVFVVTEVFGGWGFMARMVPSGGEAVFKHAGVDPAWESPRDYARPESVCYDKARDVLYISNFGADYISKVAPDGTVLDRKWVTGLANPTGLAIRGDTLFVVERSNLVEIDIAAKKIVTKHAIPEAGFPNDVALSPAGDLYISDSQRNTIYRFRNGGVERWFRSDGIPNPNGLWAESDRLIVGTSGDGCFKSIDTAGKGIKTLLHLGSGAIMDGIRPDGRGQYLMGDWTGRIFRVSPSGGKVKLLDTRDAKIPLADFEYLADRGLLIIPTLDGNMVLAFSLELQ
jgi:hypothetical protein